MKNLTKNQEQIINELYNASEWINEMISGSIHDEENSHILDMVNAIDEAMDIIKNLNNK